MKSTSFTSAETPGSDDFATRVLRWFDQHGRKNLPWQQGINPYRVWVSEIMLQQTQVNTVIPYFERFMAALPDVAALAQAPEDQVMQLWTGLGYYSRARNLHKSARLVMTEHDGQLPESVEALEKLPGIGRSTAGAIASIAMGLRAPILDGNVKRVLARHHEIAGWPGQSATLAALWQQAEYHTPTDRVAEYTQAIMDLGATMCTRRKPNCKQCPVAATCSAYASGRPLDYPGKKPKKSLPSRSVVFILAYNVGGELLLQRRPSNGIWGGLWSFPEVEREDDVTFWVDQYFGIANPDITPLPPLKHSFSHFNLTIQPVAVPVGNAGVSLADTDSCWQGPAASAERGLPAPVVTLIKAWDQSLEGAANRYSTRSR